MPPKPQTFKTPDGKEFATRAEWRDYMMATYYTFKDKNDEPSPLLKVPGDIDGQAFDISDCKNTTMAIMDHSEQVQIDTVTGCKIFIGACASSTFIRNCDNCVFYICCRQLRLREVTNSTLYVLSMAEVHIEYSSGLKFAPFNGSYPLHAEHLKTANIDPKHNLWYDVYDHNDADKSHSNWKLLPESEYEQPWFPAGAECEFAAPRVKVGSVVKDNGTESMQSFGLEQMKVDAQKISPSPATPPPLPTPSSAAQTPADDESAVHAVIQLFASANDISAIVDSKSFSAVSSSGSVVTDSANFHQIIASSSTTLNELSSCSSVAISPLKDMAYAVFTVCQRTLAPPVGADIPTPPTTFTTYTAVLSKGSEKQWKIVHVHAATPNTVAWK